jgi:hypothetical protein
VLADEEPDLAGVVRRLHARAAVQLAQDVAHVHVDGAPAEEEVLRDLAVGAPDGEQSHDFELSPRQSRAVGVRGRAHAESAAHRLAEDGYFARRFGRELARAELRARR